MQLMRKLTHLLFFFDFFRAIRGQSFFFHEFHEKRKIKKII